MEEIQELMVVGVRFSKVGKIYHFESNGLRDLKVGDMVVVETSRGWQLGQVAQVLEDAEPPPEGWKPIDRRATPRDLLMRQMWQQKEAEVVASCKAKSVELNLVGIKIIQAEYSFDGSRLTVLFSSETEEKYDLKTLRQDIQRMFAPSQVEMRQIGPRDVAKVVCGMGACGLEKRCCCAFLTEFSSISIRMAKEQGISLTPSEITGMCGRLRCCLIYEYDQYVEARKELPKKNKRVRTPQGEGKVVDVSPLRGMVTVDLPEIGYREFSGEEVSLIEDGGQGAKPQPSADAPTEAPGDRLAPDQDETPLTTTDAAIESGEAFGEEPDATSPAEAHKPHEKGQRPPRRDRGKNRPGKAQTSGEPGQVAKGPVDQTQGKQRPEGQKRRPGKGTRPANMRPGGQEDGSDITTQPSKADQGPDKEGKEGKEFRRRKGRRRNNNDSENRA